MYTGQTVYIFPQNLPFQWEIIQQMPLQIRNMNVKNTKNTKNDRWSIMGENFEIEGRVLNQHFINTFERYLVLITLCSLQMSVKNLHYICK